MTISEIHTFLRQHCHDRNKLTEPVLGRTEISPLVEDNIEDYHDGNHDVEREQSSWRGELSFVVDNHEDEKDDDSGYKIH